MTQADIIWRFIREHHGQVTIADVESIGLSKKVLYRMAQANQIEKLDPGVFIDPKEFGDNLAGLQYRFPKGIYFKDTALFLHGMIDRTPEIYEMNFPMSNPHSASQNTQVKMYRQIERLYSIGIEKVKSPGGHLVKTYNIERTLCDIIRKRDQTDAETLGQAMRNYAVMPKKNLLRLIEYADLFKVKEEIENYMAVLL
ncbi:type IV toxin-antitoxin system AbiEi family antitoxin domain-containing protein [Oenococcus sp.]|uniref:type IV toxin-antitoxin system AbiEi family antitoxin domain-containing protein n=1 Tax=Oenococcus sp. TaxID=1979414 RepID=UPI0039ED1812